MKIRIPFLLAGILGTSIAGGTVTIEFQFGKLTDANASLVPTDSLWAFVYDENGDGLLPGGLEANSSLTNLDSAAAFADFKGVTIGANVPVAGDKILRWGTVNGSAGQGYLQEIENFAGLSEGRRWGIYWFPSLTTSSNSLPSNQAFQIGAFQEDDVNGASGGHQGMKIPADASSVLTAYYDDAVVTGGLAASRFQAINATPVPEPAGSSVLWFGIFGSVFLWRRRNS